MRTPDSKSRLVWLVAVLLAGCLAACGNGETVTGCTDAALPHQCTDGQCHACCEDTHCAADEECAEDYTCVVPCLEEGAGCSDSPGGCCGGFACDLFTNACTGLCTDDAECALREEVAFSEDLKCTNGLCDFDHCRKEGQCPPGRVCFDGDCVTKPACDAVTSCIVLPASAVTQEGTGVRMTATAYLGSGALAPGMSFEWTSADDSVATPAGGEIVGGNQTGEVTITARVAGCEVTCEATITNYAAVTAGTRVVVLEALTGEAIEGARVIVGTEGPLNTDSLGAATFATELSGANPDEITVYKAEYNYTTLRDVTTNDVIVHTTRLHHLDFSTDPPTQRAGGIRGKLDFSHIRCEEGHTCDVKVGLVGLSVPGSLVSLNFNLVFGGQIRTTVELGTMTEEVVLPSGLSLCVNDICPKETYSPTGIPGSRVAWAFGGRLDLAVLVEKLGPVITGGEDIDIYEIVLGLLPLFSDFHTAVVPGVDVTPIDMAEDVDNIDDDERTTHVPDYANFTELDMTIKVAFQDELAVVPPVLPVGTYDAVVVVPGVVVVGAGFVPLGLGVGLDSTGEDDAPDGLIDEPIRVNVADVAGRIPEGQFQRMVAAVAISVENFSGETSLPTWMAGRFQFVDSFDSDVYLDVFMTPPHGTYDSANRRLTMNDLPADFDYAQVIFWDQKNVGWHILGQWVTGAYDLPIAPPAGDRARQASFTAIKLAGGITFQDLATFNGTDLADLRDLVEEFCYAELPTSP